MDDVFPQIVFYIGPIAIRDTVISTWIMIVLIIILANILGRKFPTALEMLINWINTAISDVIGRSAIDYLPFLGALGIFIAVGNVIGVLPFLSSPTKDINTPIALSLVVFFAVHYYGIRQKGAIRYFKDMATPIYVLPLEIIGQLSRTLSLSLRLFGNVISTEMVIAVIFALAPLFVPLPLVGLGILTGLLQAYIFIILAAVYIGTATQSAQPPV
jgi:F-type H+-transporting ATPase subunit a